MIRFKALNTPLFFVALLTSFSSVPVSAESKLYRSDSNMPFVKMMLSMMSAMGILDKVSGSGGYGQRGFGSGGFGPSRFSPGRFSPDGYGMSNYGMGGYGLNEFGSSPWGSNTNTAFQRYPWMQSPLSQSPWPQSAHGGASPWSSPGWGVQPTHAYSYGYSPYGPGYTPYGSRWSSADLDGWVKEPWESSEWNPDAEMSQQQAVVPHVQLQPMVPAVAPIVQNFNYNVSEEVLKNKNQADHLQVDGRQGAGRQGIDSQTIDSQIMGQLNQNNHDDGQKRLSPLAKLHQRQLLQPTSRQQVQQSSESLAKQTKQVISRQKPKNPYQQEKPCITDFCGLKKPNLNGLWVTQDGEMMGINNTRYLWNDGKSRYLKGQLKIQNEYLVASVDGHEKIMRFKYRLAGNHLLTMQPDGTIREFMRKPNNPYTGRY